MNGCSLVVNVNKDRYMIYHTWMVWVLKILKLTCDTFVKIFFSCTNWDGLKHSNYSWDIHDLFYAIVKYIDIQSYLLT